MSFYYSIHVHAKVQLKLNNYLYCGKMKRDSYPKIYGSEGDGAVLKITNGS